MKTKFILIAMITFLGLMSCDSENTTVTAQNDKAENVKETLSKTHNTPILVELFTSEG